MCVLLPAVREKEPGLLGPVVVYAVIIISMAITAFRRCFCDKIARQSKVFGLAGALFFVLSDSVLSFHKFVAPVLGGKTLVMVTYYLAQTLIALSCVYFEVKEEGGDNTPKRK